MMSKNEPHLLEINNLTVSYSKHFHLIRKNTDALHDISFTLDEQQTLALMGDASSGKTTLLNILNGVITPKSGDLLVFGKALNDYERKDRVKFVRMFYPNPETAINPHIKIRNILENPLILNTDMNAKQREETIYRTLEYVGLHPDHCSFYMSMLTPNQRLRLSLARAIELEPKILLVDATIEKLDAMLRMHFINTFLDLQKKHLTSIIICLNDLGLIRHIADKILILNNGREEDYGSTAKVLAFPQSDLTKKILKCYNHEYRGINCRKEAHTKVIINPENNL